MILLHGLEAAVTELRRGVDELEDGQSSVEQELSDRVDTDEQADLTSTCLVYSGMHIQLIVIAELCKGAVVDEVLVSRRARGGARSWRQWLTTRKSRGRVC